LISVGARSIAGVKRFIVVYAAWIVLSDGRAELLLLGSLACLLAVIVSERIWRTGGGRIRLWSLVAYAPGFVWRSLEGGIDVARRVLTPTVRIAPAFIEFDSQEDDETGRVLFCDTISLMPGTLASELDGRRTVIHLLADEPAMHRIVAEEEARVRRLFEHTDEHSGERRP
jgi:multicomponent Na+:H+ antiporter subunit E